VPNVFFFLFFFFFPSRRVRCAAYIREFFLPYFIRNTIMSFSSEEQQQQQHTHDSEGVAETQPSAAMLDVPHVLSLLLSSGLKETASVLQRELAGVSTAAVPCVNYKEEKNEHTHP
jgi:hypothetical protein